MKDCNEVLPLPSVNTPVSEANATNLFKFLSSNWDNLNKMENDELSKARLQTMVNLDFILDKSLELGYVRKGQVAPDGEWIEEGSLKLAAPRILEDIASLPSVEGWELEEAA